VQVIPSAAFVFSPTLSGTRRDCVPAAEKSYNHRWSCAAAACFHLHPFCIHSYFSTGMQAAQQRHNHCLQAPNVSLQQLIASFAAQSRQLGLQPAPRVSTADHDSISGADQHDTSTSTVLPDPDALTASRWVTFSNCYDRCLQQKKCGSTG